MEEEVELADQVFPEGKVVPRHVALHDIVESHVGGVLEQPFVVESGDVQVQFLTDRGWLPCLARGGWLTALHFLLL